jgi:hypothetical protein
MKKGKALQTITNTVLDITITLATVGEELYILEDLGNAYEVATVNEPMNTFYASKNQVEVSSDSVH